MQNTLAYQFDMNEANDSKQARHEYNGNYIIDSLSKRVIKHDNFTPNKRRMIVMSCFNAIDRDPFDHDGLFADWTQLHLLSILERTSPQ